MLVLRLTSETTVSMALKLGDNELISIVVSDGFTKNKQTHLPAYSLLTALQNILDHTCVPYLIEIGPRKWSYCENRKVEKGLLLEEASLLELVFAVDSKEDALPSTVLFLEYGTQEDVKQLYGRLKELYNATTVNEKR